jgi:hypothetical protein
MDKAQELLAKAQNVVREPLGRFVSMAREKFSLGRLRSVFLFTGVGEGKPFAMPPSHLARAQLLSNLDYYAVNYLALLFLMGFFVCMYYPGFGFWVAALCGGWYVVLFVDAPPLVLLGREVGDVQKTAAMLALTVLVVMLWCLWPITVIGALGAVVVCAHALLRESRTRATEEDGAVAAPMMPKPAFVTHLGSGMNANAAGGQAGEQAGDGSV